ncbi:hypothetical protein EMPS_05670 [Entomortierella parvispora]|uniref:Secreted protein n=1 Tax=Entomortierella parvispora TaxID=205924 RepID=A0A9P3LWQ3_9FUNG|nr:hypothetical protein EMPS_05670 [Entomortierella parvispora]
MPTYRRQLALVSLTALFCLSRAALAQTDRDQAAIPGRFSRNQIPIQALPHLPPPTDFPPDKWGNRIPDFSRVDGHVPLPIVPVLITLQPSADPRINDRARIQKAIDWIATQPLQPFVLRDGQTVIQTRGAVLLQAGIYRIQGALLLNKSGVVLRGEGNGPDGTVLMAVGQFKHDFIVLNGMLDPKFQGTSEYLEWYGGSKVLSPKDPYVVQDEDVTPLQDVYIPTGTTRLPVKDVRNFEVGGDIVVEREATQAWIAMIGTNHIKPRPEDPSRTLNWHPKQFTLRYVRKILAIEKATPSPGVVSKGDDTEQVMEMDDEESTEKRMEESRQQTVIRYTADTNRTGKARPDTTIEPETMGSEDDEEFEVNSSWVPGYLTIDIPTVMAMDPIIGPGSVYNFKRETPIPNDVGVENLALWSEYDPKDIEDERHGWFAIMIDHCENCWAADIKTRNFVSGIKAAAGSKHVTIQDCEVNDPISLRSEGGRRYMFMLQGQMGLVKRCFATDARHDFITGAKTPGPNVFVDSEGIRANNDAGPHDRWSTGTLYDNVHSWELNVRNRGWMGSSQGWSGAFHVVYHCSADSVVEFQSPPGSTNWVIEYEGRLGSLGIEFEGEDATFLDPEPQDKGRIPRSLYWSQLVARMGGSDADARMIEQLVGVRGKNEYPPRLSSRYVTADEIEAVAEGMDASEDNYKNDDDI